MRPWASTTDPVSPQIVFSTDCEVVLLGDRRGRTATNNGVILHDEELRGHGGSTRGLSPFQERKESNRSHPVITFR